MLNSFSLYSNSKYQSITIHQVIIPLGTSSRREEGLQRGWDMGTTPRGLQSVRTEKAQPCAESEQDEREVTSDSKTDKASGQFSGGTPDRWSGHRRCSSFLFQGTSHRSPKNRGREHAKAGVRRQETCPRRTQRGLQTPRATVPVLPSLPYSHLQQEQRSRQHTQQAQTALPW